MRLKPIITTVFAASVLGSGVIMPVAANAQEYHRSHQYRHRQKTKNEWRNIAIGAGALGVLGILNRDPALAFAGTAGALYSANRYEHDRRSQHKIDRARASYFSHDSFYRDGHRYH